MTVQIIWFRSDLRIRDNRALEAALAATDLYGPVIALYIATPAQWDLHHDALIKRDFWRRSLKVLEASLATINIPLVCLQVPLWQAVPGVLAALHQRQPLSRLCFNREYPLNERRRDQAVMEFCDQAGIAVQACHDRLLVPPDTVFTRAEDAFKVFTPFSRRVRELMPSFKFRAPPAQVVQPPVQTGIPLDELDWGAAASHLRQQWSELWPAGEQHALDQLREFCQSSIASYRERRDFPALPGTSRLSPHLAAGTLSPRQCWAAAAHSGDSAGVFTWHNELLWRDFYQYVMYHFPHVCTGSNWRDDLGHVQWRKDEAGFRAWCEGRTGIPLVDAAMRQLASTGWMHNRLRMVAAMFLSKNLLVDWRLGEQWFMQHLVDGDFSANNGGWQWSASTGTDAAPYFRIFNAISQSQKFDGDGEFIRQFVPELAGLDDKHIHEPGGRRPECYPAPIVDLKSSRQRAITAFRK